MPVTTLNKIINLFFVGTFAVVVIAAVLFTRFAGRDLSNYQAFAAPLGSPVAVFVATIFLLSTIILLGLVVDSLTEMLIRRLVWRGIGHHRIMSFLGSTSDVEQYNHLLRKFNDLFHATEKYRGLLGDPDYNRTLAVEQFFQTASKENIEWVVQHYSLYHLSTSYLFVLCFAPFAIPLIPFGGFWLEALSMTISMIFIYALCHQAVYMLLYSYEVVYRHGVMLLARGQGDDAAPVANQ